MRFGRLLLLPCLGAARARSCAKRVVGGAGLTGSWGRLLRRMRRSVALPPSYRLLGPAPWSRANDERSLHPEKGGLAANTLYPLVSLFASGRKSSKDTNEASTS